MIEYKKIDHFVPFLQLETKNLQHVVKIMQCEVSTVPGKNRLYYFKNMTKVYILKIIIAVTNCHIDLYFNHFR